LGHLKTFLPAAFWCLCLVVALLSSFCPLGTFFLSEPVTRGAPFFVFFFTSAVLFFSSSPNSGGCAPRHFFRVIFFPKSSFLFPDTVIIKMENLFFFFPLALLDFGPFFFYWFFLIFPLLFTISFLMLLIHPGGLGFQRPCLSWSNRCT